MNNTITPENLRYCDSQSKRLLYVKRRAKNIIAYYRHFMIGLGGDVASFKSESYAEFSRNFQTGTDYLSGIKNLMARNGEL